MLRTQFLEAAAASGPARCQDPRQHVPSSDRRGSQLLPVRLPGHPGHRQGGLWPQPRRRRPTSSASARSSSWSSLPPSPPASRWTNARRLPSGSPSMMRQEDFQVRIDHGVDGLRRARILPRDRRGSRPERACSATRTSPSDCSTAGSAPSSAMSRPSGSEASRSPPAASSRTSAPARPTASRPCASTSRASRPTRSPAGSTIPSVPSRTISRRSHVSCSWSIRATATTRSPSSCAAPAPGRRLSQAPRRIPGQARRTATPRRKSWLASSPRPRQWRQKGGADHGRRSPSPGLATLRRQRSQDASRARCAICCTPSSRAIFGPAITTPLRRQDRRTVRSLPPAGSRFKRGSGPLGGCRGRRPALAENKRIEDTRLVPIVLDLVTPRTLQRPRSRVCGRRPAAHKIVRLCSPGL